MSPFPSGHGILGHPSRVGAWAGTLLMTAIALAPPGAGAQVARVPTLQATPVPGVQTTSAFRAVGQPERLDNGSLRQVVTLEVSAPARASRTFTATPLYRGPVTPVPAGYGHYCSILYDNGVWAMAALPEADSDPCAALRKTSPGGTIQRAGLWHTAGENNVMARCQSDLRIYRGKSGTVIKTAYDEAQGKKGCIFTIAPAKLPVFGLPYGKTTASQTDPSADVSVSRGFDYNVYNVPMNVSMFGRTPASGTTTAIWVDRTGRQRDYNETVDGVTTRVDGEAAYDLPMPGGKPILAVAAGIVRGARHRDVSMFRGCGRDLQAEIYLEHQVGDGEYAERFYTYYAHGSKIDVQDGDQVARGQKIGEVGNTGCSGGDHIHLGVFRTTNLSGSRWWFLTLTPGGYGINGIHGAIDPFGWAAPKHIDPWAWMALGVHNDAIVGQVRDPGAFSIDLWKDARPPSSW